MLGTSATATATATVAVAAAPQQNTTEKVAVAAKKQKVKASVAFVASGKPLILETNEALEALEMMSQSLDRLDGLPTSKQKIDQLLGFFKKTVNIGKNLKVGELKTLSTQVLTKTMIAVSLLADDSNCCDLIIKNNEMLKLLLDFFKFSNEPDVELKTPFKRMLVLTMEKIASKREGNAAVIENNGLLSLTEFLQKQSFSDQEVLAIPVLNLFCSVLKDKPDQIKRFIELKGLPSLARLLSSKNETVLAETNSCINFILQAMNKVALKLDDSDDLLYSCFDAVAYIHTNSTDETVIDISKELIKMTLSQIDITDQDQLIQSSVYCFKPLAFLNLNSQDEGLKHHTNLLIIQILEEMTKDAASADIKGLIPRSGFILEWFGFLADLHINSFGLDAQVQKLTEQVQKLTEQVQKLTEQVIKMPLDLVEMQLDLEEMQPVFVCQYLDKLVGLLHLNPNHEGIISLTKPIIKSILTKMENIQITDGVRATFIENNVFNLLHTALSLLKDDRDAKEKIKNISQKILNAGFLEAMPDLGSKLQDAQSMLKMICTISTIYDNYKQSPDELMNQMEKYFLSFVCDKQEAGLTAEILVDLQQQVAFSCFALTQLADQSELKSLAAYIQNSLDHVNSYFTGPTKAVKTKTATQCIYRFLEAIKPIETASTSIQRYYRGYKVRQKGAQQSQLANGFQSHDLKPSLIQYCCCDTLLPHPTLWNITISSLSVAIERKTLNPDQVIALSYKLMYVESSCWPLGSFLFDAKMPESIVFDSDSDEFKSLKLVTRLEQNGNLEKQQISEGVKKLSAYFKSQDSLTQSVINLVNIPVTKKTASSNLCIDPDFIVALLGGSKESFAELFSQDPCQHAFVPIQGFGTVTEYVSPEQICNETKKFEILCADYLQCLTGQKTTHCPFSKMDRLMNDFICKNNSLLDSVKNIPLCRLAIAINFIRQNKSKFDLSMIAIENPTGDQKMNMFLAEVTEKTPSFMMYLATRIITSQAQNDIKTCFKKYKKKQKKEQTEKQNIFNECVRCMKNPDHWASAFPETIKQEIHEAAAKGQAATRIQAHFRGNQVRAAQAVKTAAEEEAQAKAAAKAKKAEEAQAVKAVAKAKKAEKAQAVKAVAEEEAQAKAAVKAKKAKKAKEAQAQAKAVAKAKKAKEAQAQAKAVAKAKKAEEAQAAAQEARQNRQTKLQKTSVPSELPVAAKASVQAQTEPEPAAEQAQKVSIEKPTQQQLQEKTFILEVLLYYQQLEDTHKAEMELRQDGYLKFSTYIQAALKEHQNGLQLCLDPNVGSVAILNYQQEIVRLQSCLDQCNLLKKAVNLSPDESFSKIKDLRFATVDGTEYIRFILDDHRVNQVPKQGLLDLLRGPL